MRFLILFAVIFSAVACQGQAAPSVLREASGQIIIANGMVIDGLGPGPIPDRIVAIEGNRIVFVGRGADFTQTPGARIIDAQGGTVLPGFIDAHVHSSSNPAFRRRFLMGGVTAVCDLGSPLADMPGFAEGNFGGKPAAQGFRSGPILTAPGGLPDALLNPNLTLEVDSSDEGRAVVKDLHARGADFIKVYLQGESSGVAYPLLGEEELAAIVDEAHSLGLLVRAHVTYASLLDMAIEAGVDTIEHVPVNVSESEMQGFSEDQIRGFLQSADPYSIFSIQIYPDYEDRLRTVVEAGIIMIPTLDRPYG